MGVELENEAHDFAVLRLPDGGTIDVFGPSLAGQVQFAAGPIVGFEVANVVTTRRELEQAGVNGIGPIHHGEHGAAWTHVRGPEGHIYKLTQRAATARLPGTVRA